MIVMIGFCQELLGFLLLFRGIVSTWPSWRTFSCRNSLVNLLRNDVYEFVLLGALNKWNQAKFEIGLSFIKAK